MRLGVTIDYAEDFADAAAEVRRLEGAGAEVFAVSEAYSFDAVSRLGYLAAITRTATLMSSILPIYSRTPALLAMTAAGLDSLSGGRFELGLGSSGPQVIEGFHGVPFARPLGHLRETVDICRTVWRRERLEHRGREYTVPLPREQGGTGLGKPLKLINRPVRASIPVAIAALTPRAVEQTAEIADGWFPFLYHPERADEAWGASLAAGAARRDPALGPLDVIVGVPLFVGRDDGSDDALIERMLSAYRERMALYVGGMGARGANFYTDLAVRYGYGADALRVQELYLAGEKAAASDALPDDFVLATSLIGRAGRVRERLQAFAASGVTTVLAQPLAPTAGGRVASFEALRGML
ncbi:LLM class F420-dependent oxidoreductase [Subtercola sp. Z020]|uniref:LLM class F420-dependent oxidoreductase n=1 Tax=Subtercola sp. Z020 TaxID=2080582 RepID=UPI000CE7C7DB|nr:LLM class F420-dependent oxidoreductase [Subtercola sp. Z020]PPF79444.1 LLM class F420-dependent oxidoreductase [Subtercola sp. Z020]